MISKLEMRLLLLIFISCMLHCVNCQETMHTFDEIFTKFLDPKRMSRENQMFDQAKDYLSSLYNSPKLRELLTDEEDAESFFTFANISEACSTSLVFAVTNQTEWSRNMFDAMGKIPTSIQYGAFHWVSGFQQCIANQPPPYYPADGEPPGTHPVRVGVYTSFKLQSTPLTIDLGLCVPDTCSDSDLYKILYKIIEIGAKVSPSIGKVRILLGTQPLSLDWSNEAIAMLVLSSVFGVVMLIGTIYDLVKVQQIWIFSRQGSIQVEKKAGPDLIGGQMNESEMIGGDTVELIVDIPESKEKVIQVRMKSLKGWEKALVAFSVYTNTLKIIDAKQQPGRLNCLDGIRFLSMSWVMLGHSCLFAAAYSNNMFYITQLMTKHWTYAAIYNATYSVDSFFVLSGLLTAYLFLKETQRNGIGRIKMWILFYVHRFWRLTPPMMLFLGFYTALFPYMSNGPFWPNSDGLDKTKCDKYWWRNLLYISDFFPTKDACMGHTWYLTHDMQFHYFIAPGILVGVYFLGLWGALLIAPVILASMIATGVIAHNNGQQLSNVASDGENIYFKPWCRVGAYAIGLLVGIIFLTYQKRKWRMHPAVVVVGWCVAFTLGLLSVYGIVGVVDGSYTVSDGVNAFYISTHRVVWSIAVSWLIFACLSGNGGWINSFLSWSAFIPLSRLTYCAYLVHPAVMYLVYMSFQQAAVPTCITLVYWFLANLVISYMVAFLLSISCESPLIGLERILLKKD